MDNSYLGLAVVLMCACYAEFVNVFYFLPNTEITACLTHAQDLVIKGFVII